jgi:DNA polymerase-3 subunit gamma/tau
MTAPSSWVGSTTSAPGTPPTAPPTSPFASDSTRKIPTASINSQPSRPETTATAGSLALASAPAHQVPQGGPQLVVSPAAAFASEIAPGFSPDIQTQPETWALAPGTLPPEPVAEIDLLTLHSTLISALAAVKGQQSASEQIEESTLTLNGNTLEIHTTLSKTMLPVILNADAERILKAALRGANAGTLKLAFLPGAAAPSGIPKKPRKATSGSAAELAEKHPIVQEARRLFSADISNVVDLREKD